jgi:hypothetical protein
VKNKKSLYILLPLALIVWGTLFWKIFFSAGNDPVIVYKPTQQVKKNIEKKDSVRRQLSYNYADPFLKNQLVTPKVEAKKTEKRSLNRVVRWPMVEFKGIVKSRRKKKTMGILQISNKKYLVRELELKDNILVFAITPDSIGLEYQNDKRYFKRHGL